MFSVEKHSDSPSVERWTCGNHKIKSKPFLCCMWYFLYIVLSQELQLLLNVDIFTVWTELPPLTC